MTAIYTQHDGGLALTSLGDVLSGKSELSSSKATSYLEEIVTLPLDSILAEPANLSSTSSQLTNALTNLCISSYPTFLSLHSMTTNRDTFIVLGYSHYPPRGYSRSRDRRALVRFGPLIIQSPFAVLLSSSSIHQSYKTSSNSLSSQVRAFAQVIFKRPSILAHTPRVQLRVSHMCRLFKTSMRRRTAPFARYSPSYSPRPAHKESSRHFSAPSASCGACACFRSAHSHSHSLLADSRRLTPLSQTRRERGVGSTHLMRGRDI